jgi:hypothetical protein
MAAALLPLFPACAADPALCSSARSSPGKNPNERLAPGTAAAFGAGGCGLWGCRGHFDMATVEAALAAAGAPLVGPGAPGHRRLSR